MIKNMTQKQFEDHIAIDTYGDFQLCGIRPGLEFFPTQGFKHVKQFNTNVTLASVSREFVFDILNEMLDLLGDKVTVILESTHGTRS